MLRVNTAPSCVPTTHTGRTSPSGIDSPLCPLSQEGCRTVNSRTEPNKGLSHIFPGITLPSWWGLMYIAEGGTSANPTPYSLPLLLAQLNKRAKEQTLLGVGIATETHPRCKSKNTEHSEWRQELGSLGKTCQLLRTLCSWGMVGKEVTKERSHLTGSSSPRSQLTSRYLRSLRGCAAVRWGGVYFICI